MDRYRTGVCRDRIMHDLIMDEAARRKGPLTILDIGCGSGFDTDIPLQESLARRADHFIGIEPDPGVEPGAYFSEVHRCFLEDAPVAANSVDVAYAIMVLEHLRSPQRFWDKVYDVLRDGGVFWALTIDGRHWFRWLSGLTERLGVKDAYLNLRFGTAGKDRYVNYPTYYRCNTPGQAKRCAKHFRTCEYFSLSRSDQCAAYFPKPFQGLIHFVNNLNTRWGDSGSLLVTKAIK